MRFGGFGERGFGTWKAVFMGEWKTAVRAGEEEEGKAQLSQVGMLKSVRLGIGSSLATWYKTKWHSVGPTVFAKCMIKFVN